VPEEPLPPLPRGRAQPVRVPCRFRQPSRATPG